MSDERRRELRRMYVHTGGGTLGPGGGRKGHARHQDPELSLDDLRDLIQAEGERIHGGEDAFVWVEELFEETAVIGVDGPTDPTRFFELGYEVDEEARTVAVEDRGEVEKVTEFVSVNGRIEPRHEYRRLGRSAFRVKSTMGCGPHRGGGSLVNVRSRRGAGRSSGARSGKDVDLGFTVHSTMGAGPGAPIEDEDRGGSEPEGGSDLGFEVRSTMGAGPGSKR